ncbi:hypothetical protein CFIMG_003589RAa [Ceratocystis fimbriata CBS 114723]|uniref:Uncharacterized protein n=1 Tax=Ceratocystis fimbriata CBS 114723 TaxID=1035309 RepID=A0A2C5X466_9PEZI|nr:hypothetical protein CFIMG_003589RAa [Ceratocystis fimbriata CBS 114723]
MAHLTRRIPVTHSGAKDGWEEVDQVGFDPSKVYRSPIDLKVAASVRLHSHKFTWREAEATSGFSDAFLGSRIWSLSEMIRVFAETIVQGNPEVPGYEVPQEYQWRIPYNRDFVLGKSAAYFTKAIRFTGGFDQVCEVLRSPTTVALVIRSMVMQVIIEKVFRVSFFGFAVDESSIGKSIIIQHYY